MIILNECFTAFENQTQAHKRDDPTGLILMVHSIYHYPFEIMDQAPMQILT